MIRIDLNNAASARLVRLPRWASWLVMAGAFVVGVLIFLVAASLALILVPLVIAGGAFAAWQMRRVADYIEENFGRNIRLEELATLAGLSQSHFSHAFKASTGVPPHQWQMQARIDHVKELMMRTDMALTDIAIAAGFSDQAHFSRVFRKMVGVSPSVWQKIRQ